MNVTRSAAGEGRKPFDSNFARMKESMGVRIQLWSLTVGIEGRVSERNDHQLSPRSWAGNKSVGMKIQPSKTNEPAPTFNNLRIFYPIAGLRFLSTSRMPSILSFNFGVGRLQL